MRRLLEWTPQNSDVLRDGDLTTKNLALEAGVGRATLYRADALLQEWDRTLAEIEAGETVALAPQARVRQLEKRSRELASSHAAETAQLRHTVNILAQQVQFLTLELERERSIPKEQVDIIPLASRRPEAREDPEP